MTARGKDLLARMARSRPSGTQTLARLFAAYGVRRVYTVPGDLSFGLLAAFLAEGMQVTSCRSQATAVFAAAGDVYASGKLQSLVLAPRGPGVQNAMAAMASTMDNGLPVLLVSPTEDQGTDRTGGFQAGTTGLQSGDGFAVLHVHSPERACAEVAEVLTQCSGPLRNSALIEIPRSLLDAELAPAEATPAPEQPINTGDLQRMAEVLAEAKHPVMVVGHQARWSLDLGALEALAKRLNAPICPTGLTIGFAGEEVETLGQDAVHDALAQADAVLLVGAALDWTLRLGAAIAPSATVFQLRDHPDTPAGARQPDLVALGDLGETLRALTQAIPPRAASPFATPMGARPLPPKLRAQVLDALARDFPARTGLVLDGGTGLILAARNIRPDAPWARLTPGLTGHLGGGLGHAMGLMASGRFDQVVLVSGDFSLGLSLADLETVQRLGLPVKILVANNLGMAGGKLQMRPKTPGLVDYHAATDYAAIMRGFGGEGHLLRSLDDWPQIATQLFATRAPCLVDMREEG